MGFPERMGYGNGLIAIGQSNSDVDDNELVQNICQQNSPVFLGLSDLFCHLYSIFDGKSC